VRCRRCVPAYIDLDVSIPARVTLVHDFCGEYLVEGEHIPMGEPFLVGMAFNIAKPGEIIQHFSLCARWFGRQSMPFLDEPDLLQR
jgi:hypothetical protein